ncbi:MAG: sulfotransferase, partial [Gammaproteobacteria bacterium]|nr:sulfotransferase [Gammaproteobacteria bacterium]
NLGTIFLQQQEFQKAIEYLYHAIKLSPTFIAAHCNIGLALLGLNQYDDALLYFTKTLQINPDYAEAYYGIAKSHLHKHHFIEAEKNIRQAITLNFHQTEFHQLLAEIYCEQSKHRQALTSLDHALSIDSTLTGLYISKGSVLMEMGEISKAEEQFSKMMYDPSINTRILAYYSLVQLRKNLPNSKLINELLSINTHDVCKSKLPYLYFALGKCHDDIGEWSKAFEYFNKGCYLKRESITYNINEHIQFTQKLIDCFSKNTIEYFRQFANSSKLPIFIVGMPRSGTTLVEQILARHPNICAGGELPYLNDLIQTPVEHHKIKLHYPENILKLSPSNIVNQYLYYLRCISSNADHITDKMPSNFITLGLIHALFPNAKIIHVKRNAIDTCLSCYTKLFSQGHLYSYDLIELGHYYHCYDLIMQHWQNILPPHSFLEINYENIVDNLEMEAKRLIDYCNLPWNSACLTFYHSKRQIRTASFMQVRQPIYRSSVNRWHRFENELAPLLKILNIKIRQ